MTSSKDDGRSLPLHPPIDSQPFLKCAEIYRRIAIGVSVVGMIHILALQFVGSAPSAKVVVAICVGYPFLGILFGSCSSLLEEKAESALMINAIRALFPSGSKYVLLLRSFHSKLVSESLSQMHGVERDEIKYFRGEPYLTGKKIMTYERQSVGSDDVRKFLVSAVGELHVVMVDGEARNISARPFCMLSSEQQWRDVVKQLAADAQIIAVVPEASSSLIDEIRMIASENLHKTMFMMPSSHARWKQGEPYISGMTRRDRWTESMPALPIALPDYSESGAILICPHVDAPPVSLPYTIRTVAELSVERQGDGAPLAAALQSLNEKGLLSPMLDELANKEAYLANFHTWLEIFRSRS